MAHVTLNVPDISCGHCERTIQQALGKVAGVRTVAVDIPARRVKVDYDEQQVTVKDLTAAVEREDYPVASVDSST
jgi:copper chaperone CopZ